MTNSAEQPRWRIGRWRWPLAIGLLLAASVTGFLLLKGQFRLFSSPSKMRVGSDFDGRTLTSYESRKLEPVASRGWDPSVPFSEFELKSTPLSSVDAIELRVNKPVNRLKKTLSNRFSEVGPVGDDQIELVAFSMLFPDWTGKIATPEFGPLRHAGTLRVISETEREELGVPFSMTADHSERPTLQLWFRFRNFHHIRIHSCDVGDHRTGVLLGKNEWIFAISNQEWVPISVELDCWHDTPLRVRIEFLTGEPEYIFLPRESGAEAEFENRLRVQFVGEFADPRPDRADFPDHNLYQMMSDRREGVQRHAILRGSDPGFAEHCGFVGENGEDRWWRARQRGHLDEDSDLFRARIPKSAKNNENPHKIVLLPKIAELEFKIPALPDMPNSRQLQNLFEVEIQALPVQARWAENQIVQAAAKVAQVKLDVKKRNWQDSGFFEPLYFPKDVVLRNVTPQQLLDDYVANTPGANYRFDAERNVLIVNEEREKSKLKRAREWWNGWAPDWLKL